jgi:hypothetical protein
MERVQYKPNVLFLAMRGKKISFIVSLCAFLKAVFANRGDACLRVSAIGRWDNDTFFPFISSPRTRERRAGHLATIPKARVLLVGDSLDRNIVRDACTFYGKHPEPYLGCAYPYGEGLFCATDDFELASFFMFGSVLNENGNIAGNQHACEGIPDNTRARIGPEHVRRCMQRFTEEPDIVLVQSVQWTLQFTQGANRRWRDIFYQERATADFARQYVANMTFIVRALRKSFPRSAVYLHTVPPIEDESGRFSSSKSVLETNRLIRVVASAAKVDCVADFEHLASSYSGVKLEDDGRHPVHTINVAFGKLIVGAAKLQRRA